MIAHQQGSVQRIQYNFNFTTHILFTSLLISRNAAISDNISILGERLWGNPEYVPKEYSDLRPSHGVDFLRTCSVL